MYYIKIFINFNCKKTMSEVSEATMDILEKCQRLFDLLYCICSRLFQNTNIDR